MALHELIMEHAEASDHGKQASRWEDGFLEFDPGGEGGEEGSGVALVSGLFWNQIKSNSIYKDGPRRIGHCTVVQIHYSSRWA